MAVTLVRLLIGMTVRLHGCVAGATWQVSPLVVPSRPLTLSPQARGVPDPLSVGSASTAWVRLPMASSV
jgi:hypothetical protein